jgi:hypothetical protein
MTIVQDIEAAGGKLIISPVTDRMEVFIPPQFKRDHPEANSLLLWVNRELAKEHRYGKRDIRSVTVADGTKGMERGR